MTHIGNIPSRTPVPSAATSPGVPLVLVLEERPGLSATVAELCSFLRIRMESVSTGEALREALEVHRPIGVLAQAGACDLRLAMALEIVARHDPSLPVLLLTGEEEKRAAGLDETSAPRPLSNLYWLPSRPGIRTLVEFLFMAERRGGVGGLMPI
jgi:hypothetical protein